MSSDRHDEDGAAATTAEERDRAEPETGPSGPEAPGTSEAPGTPDDPDADPDSDAARAGTWPVVLLAPALLVLRFFGEHTWVYWATAVAGALGVIASAVVLAACVSDLRHGRHRLHAVGVALLLAGGSLVTIARLIELRPGG
ncbi:hypothetical protein [Streptomyces sp. NPDC005805]|uniref:hypothetical protein n=1 Tax=Streptomyces sp. NPDC005805 TaxID=3157068 RepID=UPI0033EF8ACF